MNMLSMTNEHRRCMGLEEIQDTWECVEAPNGARWYFDENDVIRKVNEAGEDRYYEYSLAAEAIEGRTKLCPKTARGKIKKLTPSAVEAASRHGVYIYYGNNSIRLGNYTNQRGYYWGQRQAGEKVTPEEFPAFIDRWVRETDEEELQRVQEFATAGRKHIRFRKGDIFRIRFDRKRYGYGQILFDVWKFQKAGNERQVGGHLLIAQLFRIVTEDAALPVETLIQYPRLPSKYIYDNDFLYGDNEIIGHAELPAEPDYPILYGRSRDALKPHTITFECEPIHLDIPDSEHTLIENPHCTDKLTQAFGGWLGALLRWNFSITPADIEACIREDSNASLYNEYDLRAP